MASRNPHGFWLRVGIVVFSFAATAGHAATAPYYEGKRLTIDYDFGK